MNPEPHLSVCEWDTGEEILNGGCKSHVDERGKSVSVKEKEKKERERRDMLQLIDLNVEKKTKKTRTMEQQLIIRILAQ